MKKTLIYKVFALSLIMGVTSSLYAEKSPEYISPDNNGVQDELVVPLQIKEKRYISEWSFIIYNEKGNVVRIIGNKEKRPESFSFKSFFKALFSPKTGVDIPSQITWNGFLGEEAREAGLVPGTVAPDGNYYYQFTASDDNGNTATTSKMLVIVKCTPPEINLKQIGEAEKTFGEGAKATLKINQSGSEEDLWLGTINNAYGSTVRTFRFENSEPLSISWDGTDDNGNVVADGVYSYSITATDRAGNKSENAVINNIIYSGEKPNVATAIAGSKYFSPNADKINDELNLSVQIDRPSSSANSLLSWSVVILDSNKKAVRTYEGTNNPPSSISFDGKDDNGAAVSDGQYIARVSAHYLNGYEPVVESPVFILDTTVPAATVLSKATVFNGETPLVINQKATVTDPEYTGKKDWIGQIVMQESQKAVKTYEFGEVVPDTVNWDGTDDAGNFCADGDYLYVLTGSEPSGNVGSYPTSSFKLDTAKTEVRISVNTTAFSPFGNSDKKSVTFTPVVNAESGVAQYTLSVLDSKNKVVYTESGTKLPKSIQWNGLSNDGIRCPEGTYTASFDTVANSGTKGNAVTKAFELDIKAPEIEISVPYLAFSPDGVSTKQTLPVKVLTSSSESKWIAELKKGTTLVKTFTWQDSRVSDFEWDGRDESGNVAANGNYTLEVSSIDAAGNKGSCKIENIVLDTRETKAYLTASNEGFSPNGDGIKDTQLINVRTTLSEGIEQWELSIVDANGNTVRSWNEKDSANLPAQFTWAGDAVDSKGKVSVANGTYTAKLNVLYSKGNVVEAVSSSFVCTALPPVLNVRTAPNYFSPDDDGVDDDLFIQLKCQTLANVKNWNFTIYDRTGASFWKTSGKNSITERIIWDGIGNNGEKVQSAEEYPYEFTVTDDLGMASTYKGVISTDVLVVRDGDYLKMQVPAIIFRSDAADFGLATYNSDGSVKTPGITQAQLDNNTRVLKRISEILKKFSNYDVIIVGHANSASGTAAENESAGWWGVAAQPLSKERAEFVKKQLVSYGISATRLATDGKGTTEMVAPYNDKSVNWKNRRVEFILIKK